MVFNDRFVKLLITLLELYRSVFFIYTNKSITSESCDLCSKKPRPNAVKREEKYLAFLPFSSFIFLEINVGKSVLQPSGDIREAVRGAAAYYSVVSLRQNIAVCERVYV